MVDSKWRKELDGVIEENLKELIKETKEFDYAISKAKDKSKAQMWVAMAILNHKINNFLIKNKKYEKKMTSEELDKVLNVLEKL
jgi:hypothetical protein